jgi:DNA (cytosine-5)-methyltransferase 1
MDGIGGVPELAWGRRRETRSEHKSPPGLLPLGHSRDRMSAKRPPGVPTAMQSADEMRAREVLRAAYSKLGRHELARELETDEKTIARWHDGDIPRPRFVWHAVSNLLRQEAPRVEPLRPEQFTFIDLFAGIGGTRLGFERVGGRCLFTSEQDRFCAQTYQLNFRPDHAIDEDICRITAQDAEAIDARVPDHDVLVAGFPCQPFSIAGVSKKNALGDPHGFACKTQGTLFFDICRILEVKRPLAFMLENVRNLKSHDQGRTFTVITDALVELGYHIQPVLIDAKPWVPQHRERIFIVGFREPTGFSMESIRRPGGTAPVLRSILHPENGAEAPEGVYTVGERAAVHEKYTLTAHLWKYLRDYAKKHQAAGNGFGFGLVTPKNTARTLSARYYKDGSEILVSRGPRRNPRRLTPRECARLMGFPDSFRIPVSDTQAYRQFGNSVVVPVVEAVATAMRPHVLALRAAQANPEQVAMRV